MGILKARFYWLEDNMESIGDIPLRTVKRRKKISKEEFIINAVIYFLLALFAVVILFPIISTLLYSLNEPLEAGYYGVSLIPRHWSLENYADLFKEYVGFRRGVLTTLARTLIGTVCALASNALLSFILSRKKFLFRSGLSLFWVITMYAQGGFVPTYLLYKYLCLHESFWVYIIPNLVGVMYVLVMRTYMKNIPDSLEEAAQLEGAGYLRIFWSVISPVCKPVYAATALFIATYHWNSVFDVLIYNRFKPEYTTLQFELWKYFSELTTYMGTSSRSPTPQPVKAAASLLTMLPMLILYPFLQKYFVTGLSFSGVKD